MSSISWKTVTSTAALDSRSTLTDSFLASTSCSGNWSARDRVMMATSRDDFGFECLKGEGRATVKGRRKGDVRAMATVMPEQTDNGTGVKTDEYNMMMQRQMKNPYEYHHELGMYYTRITDYVVVGSQPQTKDDIDRLYHAEGVKAILNLQQDKDIEYWGIDFQSILRRCEELGIWHMRRPARDFDPQSLRQELPRAVAALEWAVSQGKTIYVHCTAGLGRAPAVAIAYLFWFQDMDMDTAYNFLTSKRPCGPKKEAIRGATYDLAKNDPWKESFEQLPDDAFTGVAPWERQLIQERVHGLRGQ